MLGAFICYIVGLIGYLTFLDDTKSDILENFSGVIATFCKLGVIVHFNLLIPGYFVIMRSSFFHFLQLVKQYDCFCQLRSNKLLIDESQMDDIGKSVALTQFKSSFFKSLPA